MNVLTMAMSIFCNKQVLSAAVNFLLCVSSKGLKKSSTRVHLLTVLNGKVMTEISNSKHQVEQMISTQWSSSSLLLQEIKNKTFLKPVSHMLFLLPRNSSIISDALCSVPFLCQYQQNSYTTFYQNEKCFYCSKYNREVWKRGSKNNNWTWTYPLCFVFLFKCHSLSIDNIENIPQIIHLVLVTQLACCTCAHLTSEENITTEQFLILFNINSNFLMINFFGKTYFSNNIMFPNGCRL